MKASSKPLPIFYRSVSRYGNDPFTDYLNAEEDCDELDLENNS